MTSGNGKVGITGTPMDSAGQLDGRADPRAAGFVKNQDTTLVWILQKKHEKLDPVSFRYTSKAIDLRPRRRHSANASPSMPKIAA